MSFFYLNFSKATPDVPWVVTETTQNRKQMILQKYASELEINVPCKTFVGKFHYFACEGEITWDGTKAIINNSSNNKFN
jgi:hypothetical protein